MGIRIVVANSAAVKEVNAKNVESQRMRFSSKLDEVNKKNKDDKEKLE